MEILDEELFHRAIAVRDARFDGVFYLGVASTHIYCRPVCPARRPLRKNCRFFRYPAVAERAGFRPCLRCRPELAPGSSPVEVGSRLAGEALHLIESGALGDGESLESLAAELGVSSRHLRRVVRETFGVSPVDLAQTQRLLLAKKLLAETHLPVGEVALASGFRSLRRCNALFEERYGLTPSSLRGSNRLTSVTLDTLTLSLSYRKPFAWAELLRYFAARSIPGVEWVTDDFYARTIAIQGRVGWLRVSHEAEKSRVLVEIPTTLVSVLPQLLSLVRRAFDLDAVPAGIADVLGGDELLAPSLAATPGLRLPGTMDGFETAVRTIIGQQVSVAAATTVMGRVVRAFGEPVTTPWPELNRLTVLPEHLANQTVDQLAPLGLNSARASALAVIAREVVSGRVNLTVSADPERTMAQLQKLPGIGPWTAHYFGMRILGWPDAFIGGDLVVRKMLAPLNPREIEARSQIWRPWRAYAVMHLWRSSGFFKDISKTNPNPITPIP